MATFTALNLTAFSHFIPSIDYIFIYIFFLRLPRFVPPPLSSYMPPQVQQWGILRKSTAATLAVAVRRFLCRFAAISARI